MRSPARFKVTRSKVPARRPWILKDAARPAFRGAYSSHALALAAMDAKLSIESGIPTRREIREAMHRGQHLQGCVSCYAYLESNGVTVA